MARQTINYDEFVGTKKSRLTVLEIRKDKIGNRKTNVRYFYCECECGKRVNIICHHFINRKNISCGCFRNDMIKSVKMIDNRSHTVEYKTYCNIKDRCYNKNSTSYDWYGRRGIIMCDRWLKDYTYFLEDMGEKPTKYHSIERIDNNGDYEPGNCIWALVNEQNNNKSNNKKIKFRGETKTVTEWARDLNISPSTLFNRLGILKWSIDKALTTGPKKYGK